MLRLSKRVHSLFLDLVKTKPLAELKEIIREFRIVDKVSYNPANSEYRNVFRLDYGGIRFTGALASRHFDGLGILDFIVSVLSTHIKSTWMENIIEAEPQYRLVSSIAHDAISAMIVAISDHYVRRDNLDSLPPRIVQLVAPFLASKSDYPAGITPFSTVESRANAEFVYKKFFSRSLTELGYKLADHELFMVGLVKLLNAEIDLSPIPITRNNINNFIKQKLCSNDFRTKVKDIAQLSFQGEIFIRSLIDGKGYKDLENMLLIKDNLDRLLVTDSSDNVRFGLLLDYKPHFKTEEMLSIEDFPNDRVTVIAPGYWSSIQSDKVLHNIISEHGALVPIYIPGGNLGEIILTPASLLANSIQAGYEPGHKDRDGNVHTGYFLCDDDGVKLNSKLKLEKSGLSIRPRSDWANNFFDYSLVYNEDIKSFIYQSNFYSAYTIRTGKVIHSNLQNTYLNLEHINPSVDNPLPNLESMFSARKTDARVQLRKNLIPEISEKASGLANVLNQLGGLFTHRRVKSGKILASEYFLNLQNEGYRYSIPLFKEILASLKPKSGDAIFDDGSMGVDPTKDNYWLNQITRGQPVFRVGRFGKLLSTGEFKRNAQKINNFYEAWLDIIQNHLSKGKSDYFEMHRGNLELLVFTASEDTYQLIDIALEDAFGYTGFISLLAGIMTFSEKPSVLSGYKIDFWCHNGELQSELIRDFVGRSLQQTTSADISGRLFQHIPEYNYLASIFLFGARRGNRLIKPSSSFFIDNYYRKHIFLSARDYLRATDRFLYRSFSQYLGVQKLSEMNIKGRLEIFNFLVKKLNFALEKTPLPHEGCKELYLNQLMEKIIHPTYDDNDFVLTLRNIFFTGSSGVIALNIKIRRNYKKISFEVTYDELMKMITPDQVFTMIFNWDTINRGVDYIYNLDFDLVWGNLASKVESAYTLLKEILNKAPIDEGKMLKVEFYQRTPTGIKPITEKTSSSLSTSFTQFEFYIDPDPENKEDLQTKVLSMVFWMMMEPNIVPVVSLPNGDNYLIMDIHKLYDENQFSEDLTDRFSPPSDFEQHQKQYSKIFSRSDLMNFLNFHNHEQSDRHSDMISYVMAKFKIHYVNFLEADTKSKSKLFDLR